MIALRRLRSLKRDQRGIVAPFVAMIGTVLVGSAGLALDVGLYYVGNRDLRAATEAAALAAAQYPDQATARAQAYLIKNGYQASVLQSVEVGRYCPDITIAAANRFDTTMTRCPGNLLRTAVRLHTAKASRQFLSSALGSASPIPALDATATASRIDEAGLGITTGILTVNAGLVGAVNDLLGALLNIHLTLDGSQIGALMSSNIDAGRFFDALAARVGETGTYSDLMSRSVPLADILAAGATSAAADGNSATATVFNLLAPQVNPNYSVHLSGLFGLGVWSKIPVGEATSQQSLRAGLNAYQLLAFSVQGGGGKIDLSDAVSRVVSGSTVRIAGMATGPVDRPRFAFGPSGETSVGTSAIRLQLQLGVGDISVPLLSLTPISIKSVPVLIDIAAGTAQITSIECGEEAATDSVVRVSANTGLVNAYIGEAPANAMISPMPTLSASDIGTANLVNVLGLLTVDARAVAQPVLGNSGTIAFGPGGQGTIGRPPAAGTPASIGNGSQVGPLLTSLVSSISASGGVNVTLLKLCLPLVCSDSILGASARTQILSGIVTPLSTLANTAVDPLVDNLLAALGLQLGHATMWVTGARCGVPVLI